jgi:hypothetical protein
MEGTCLRRWTLGLKHDLSGAVTAPGYPVCHFPLFFLLLARM